MRAGRAPPLAEGAAATGPLTFGRYAGNAPASSGPATKGAPDEDEEYRWWVQKAPGEATVAGAMQRDIRAFWQSAAAQGPPGQAQAKARAGNASNISLSDGDAGGVAAAAAAQQRSSYKSDFCAAHGRVGRRGVVQSREAMQAVRAPELGLDALSS